MTSQNRLLIIDPMKNLRDIYRMFLEEEKYSIGTAANLKEASQKLLQDHYAVLITEFLPPFEEAFRMLLWIKEQSPETCIIIATSENVDEKTYEKLFDIGVNDLILKPYSPEKILVHVKKGLRDRSIILRKRELEKRSVIDPITEKLQQPIFNLAHFRKCLRQEVKRARRHRHPLSLIFTEIPEEATVRDRLESFMVEMINIFRNNTREEDVVGRANGGFGILLPETDEAGSQALIKRLMYLVQSHPPFRSEETLKSLANVVSFQAFTYPEKFVIPGPLGSILEELST